MNSLTDNEIIKALENCGGAGECQKCSLNNLGDGISLCIPHLTQSAVDLINRLKAENEDLFCKLTGVMHFVDKWLDGDDLKKDEVTRAATMREKTLQITEEQQAEVERLKEEIGSLNKAYPCTVKMNDYCLIYARSLEDYDNLIGEISSEAVEKFAERVKELTISKDFYPVFFKNILNEAKEEMIGESRDEND